MTNTRAAKRRADRHLARTPRPVPKATGPKPKGSSRPRVIGDSYNRGRMAK